MLCDFSTTLPQLHESVFDVEVEILAVIAFNLVRLFISRKRLTHPLVVDCVVAVLGTSSMACV